jgi:hypothetical protein
MLPLSAGQVSPGGPYTATLTVYPRPASIVAAQIALARFTSVSGGTNVFASSVEAYISDYTTSGVRMYIGNKRTPTLSWVEFDDITFVLEAPGGSADAVVTIAEYMTGSGQ